MDCLPIQDECHVKQEIRQLADDSIDHSGDVLELGVLNGKRYSFILVDGSPVIAIENEHPYPTDKVIFLMEK